MKLKINYVLEQTTADENSIIMGDLGSQKDWSPFICCQLFTKLIY